MKTTEKENSENKQVPFGKTKFLEYSTADKGQHFITVLQGKTVVGRIYREFDNTAQKPIYTAKDAKGNPVFMEQQNLSGIKKCFTTQQKEVQSPEQNSKTVEINNEKEKLGVSKLEITKDRGDELKQLREQKNNPEKKNELGR